MRLEYQSMTAANMEGSAFKEVFIYKCSKEKHMMFCWEQRIKLYMIKIFQIYANMIDPLLDCTAEKIKDFRHHVMI